MKEAHNFFNKYKEGIKSGLFTCSLARIERFDPNLMQADVTPLYAEDLSIIQNCPVNTPQTNEFIIRVPHKVGDIVTIVFSQRDIDPILYGGGKQSTRTLGIDDAIVMGGINLFTTPLSVSDHDKDLIIALKKDFGTKFVIRPDGSVLMEATKDIDIVSKQNVNITGVNINLNEGATT